MKPEYHEVMGVRQMGKRHGKPITRYFLRYNARMMSKGMCRGIDTEVFYPPKDLFTRDEERMIDKMCAGCPIKQACLEWGLAHERYGVWGGTTPAMRNRLRSRVGWDVTDPSNNPVL